MISHITGVDVISLHTIISPLVYWTLSMYKCVNIYSNAFVYNTFSWSTNGKPRRARGFQLNPRCSVPKKLSHRERQEVVRFGQYRKVMELNKQSVNLCRSVNWRTITGQSFGSLLLCIVDSFATVILWLRIYWDERYRCKSSPDTNGRHFDGCGTQAEEVARRCHSAGYGKCHSQSFGGE